MIVYNRTFYVGLYKQYVILKGSYIINPTHILFCIINVYDYIFLFCYNYYFDINFFFII